MAPISDFWNEERLTLLTANWTTRSAGDIASELGTTRSAVIGKAHRLRLPAKRQPAPTGGKHARWLAARAKKRKEQAKAPQARSVPPEPVPGPAPVEGGLHIMQLQEQHCRAIVGSGDDGLARYCGAHKEGRIITRSGSMISAYCRDHGLRYYNRPDSVCG